MVGAAYEYSKGKLVLEAERPTLQFGPTGDTVRSISESLEKEIWDEGPSLLVWLRDQFLSVPPPLEYRIANVRGERYRNGLVFLETRVEPEIHIVRDNDPDGTRVQIPCEFPGGHCLLQVSDDASILVAKSGVDTFQIWSIDFPKYQLLQECRIALDESTDTLSLVQIDKAASNGK